MFSLNWISVTLKEIVQLSEAPLEPNIFVFMGWEEKIRKTITSLSPILKLNGDKNPYFMITCKKYKRNSQSLYFTKKQNK